ncbi:MAG: SDR family NAD(P)-dependent oxidoreductase, partial [Desulfobacteraceae bacterium]|nr:SDR family NAD(P)-dependent oxidoreductase [Desulfobacteraceae bacterium]
RSDEAADRRGRPEHAHRDAEILCLAHENIATVKDLVQWAESLFETPDAAGAPREAVLAENPNDQGSQFHRYVLKLIPRPLHLDKARSFDGLILILDGGHPLALHIQMEASKKGLQCLRVMADPSASRENNGCFRFNASKESEYQECYERIKKRYGSPAGVLNMLALGQNTPAAAYDAVIHSFLWAKVLGADRDLLPYAKRQFFWMSVSGMGGDFGLNHEADFEAGQNGPHGITKSLFHEWPGVQAKTIDVHPQADLEQLSRAILNECGEVNTTIKEIGFLNLTRHEMALADQPLASINVPSRFNSESVFLITGGANGITADVAALLAKEYAPTLIVTGRTSLPERAAEELDQFMTQAALAEQDPKQAKAGIIAEFKSKGLQVAPALVNERYNAMMKEFKARQNIAKMRRFNAKVFYHSCDCTHEESFSRLIAQVYQQHGKIDGVIHAAGYLKDGVITQKSVESFKRVLDTKVQGARILMGAIDFEMLDFIVFFSSVSGRFGNQGQADYAAANEMLNKMAVKINHQWPGKAMAINWGPWEGEGMVSDQVKKQFDQAGVYLLPRAAGARMLKNEINQPGRAAEVVIFGARDIEKRLPVVHLEEAPAQLPLAGLLEPLETTDHQRAAWHLTLDPSAPYLNDHRINGIAVLPAAMAMEIMAQAAMAALPGYRFKGIHDFKLIKGITLPSGGRPKLTVTAEKQSGATDKSALIDVRLAMPDQEHRCNYSACVILTKEKNGHVPLPSSSKHSRSFDQSIEQVYEQRLFHTGVFKGLKTIESIEIADLQNNGIRGRAQTSSPEHILGAAAEGAWLIDPVVFDCAYQLSLLWIQECYSMMALPGDVKKYIQYRPYNGGPIHCDVVVKTANFPKVILDFHFSDGAGVLYAKAADVAAIMKKELNKTRPGSIQRETAVSS